MEGITPEIVDTMRKLVDYVLKGGANSSFNASANASANSGN